MEKLPSVGSEQELHGGVSQAGLWKPLFHVLGFVVLWDLLSGSFFLVVSIAHPVRGFVAGSCHVTQHTTSFAGTYFTHEAKGADDAADADTAIINAEGGQNNSEEKKEYFI